MKFPKGNWAPSLSFQLLFAQLEKHWMTPTLRKKKKYAFPSRPSAAWRRTRFTAAVCQVQKARGGSLRVIPLGLDLTLPGLSLKYSSESLPSAALFFSRGRVSSSTVSYLDSKTAIPGHCWCYIQRHEKSWGYLSWPKRWILQRKS